MSECFPKSCHVSIKLMFDFKWTKKLKVTKWRFNHISLCLMFGNPMCMILSLFLTFIGKMTFLVTIIMFKISLVLHEFIGIEGNTSNFIHKMWKKNLYWKTSFFIWKKNLNFVDISRPTRTTKESWTMLMRWNKWMKWSW